MKNLKNKNILKFFFNKLLDNFKNSDKLFYCYFQEKHTYKNTYIKLKKVNYVLHKSKKKRIAVFSDKSIGYYISVISIILSGKTWIQISNSYPPKKIAEIIKFANIQFGIVDKSFKYKNKIMKLNNLKLIDFENIISSTKIKEFDTSKIHKKNIACIFFTSGSTGNPKGVKISYLNLAESANYQIKNIEYNSSETLADCHDTSFVMSLNTIFPICVRGNTISPLINLNDKIFPFDHFKKNKVTTLITVPSFILFHRNKIKDLSIKNLILCGEKFPINILKIILKNVKFKNLYNFYGSTELSTWAFYYKYNSKDLDLIKDMGQVPIGKAFKKINVIVNNNGELCVSGNIVSQGYLNNNKENLEKFYNFKYERFYNTGDLVEKKKNFYFVKGRNDSLVKIKGYRVDLNEIDNTIKKLKNVNFCFSYISVKKRSPHIISVFQSSKQNYIQSVNSVIKKNLPNYMMPKKIYQISNIPFNKNGKIDRVKIKKKFY